MNLRTLFAIPIAVVLLVTLSLAGMMAGQGWSGADARAPERPLRRVKRACVFLPDLQNDLRSERYGNQSRAWQGPPAAGTDQRATDRDVRRRTDQSIAAIAAEITARGSDEHDALAGPLYSLDLCPVSARARQYR